MSLCENENLYNIDQLDGNTSICSNENVNISNPRNKKNPKKVTAALNLPIVATYNLRSLMPKVQSLKNDLLERSVDLGFLQEIWEKSDIKTHQFKIEKMIEMDGLLYISNPRPKNAKGRTYGGAAIVVNTDNIFM